MHPNELHVSAHVVRSLLDVQFKQFRGEPIQQLLTAGTVNAIFLIGDGAAARFPLEPGDPIKAAAAIKREANAMNEFAEHPQRRS